MDIRTVDNATVIGCAVRQIHQAVELLDSLNIKTDELMEIEFRDFKGSIRQLDFYAGKIENARFWIISNKKTKNDSNQTHHDVDDTDSL